MYARSRWGILLGTALLAALCLMAGACEGREVLFIGYVWFVLALLALLLFFKTRGPLTWDDGQGRSQR